MFFDTATRIILPSLTGGCNRDSSWREKFGTRCMWYYYVAGAMLVVRRISCSVSRLPVEIHSDRPV